jgi:transaldolase
MQIFLDTANIDQIRQAARLGVISGVTTNPTLMSKEGKADYQAVVKEICSIIPGPISVEVLVEGVKPMIKQARLISSWAPNIVIKIPATTEGLEVTSALAKENIKVNFTLCFSLNQALLGALAGAAYVSPFVGRLDDVGHNGMEVVKDIVDVFQHYHLPTGAHIATVPYDVLMQMIHHPLTDVGVAGFLSDWQGVSRK